MRRTSFNQNWEMRPHANFFAELVGTTAAWRAVTLPHDATLAQTRDPAEGSATGYVPGGVYEYRTTFAAPRSTATSVVLARVRGRLPHRDGVRQRQLRRPLGDRIHRLLWFDARRPSCASATNNEIRVVCRAHKDSRWYSGAGIHRPVHLVVGALVHIALDGVRVTTTERRRRVRGRRGRDDGRAATAVVSRRSIWSTEIRDAVGGAVVGHRRRR